MQNQGALANFDDDAAIAQIASGKLMHQLGAEYGCSKVAIRKRLINHPDYKQAIDSQAESLVDQSTSEMMDVDADAVLIARARARVDAAHKWAAARDPGRWAPKGNTVNVQVNVVQDGGLTALAGSLLGDLRVAHTPK